MATLKEIAQKAGVSIGTVDRVLHGRGRVSESTRETILALVKELDYKPNHVVRALAIRRRKLKFDFFITDPVRHPFFEEVMHGVEEKKKELAQYEAEVEIHIVDLHGEPFNVENWKTDGIAMIPVPQLENVRVWAAEHEVPVVYYNIPRIPREGSMGYVGCDYEKAGRIAAGICALLTNEKGKVALLSEGNDQVLSYHNRVKGFLEEAGQRYPEMRIVEKRYTTELDPDLDVLAKQMMEENPDLDAVYLVNPGDSHVCATIHELANGRQIRIVTNDLTDKQREYMEAGLISATICQQPRRQGSQPLELLFRYYADNAEGVSRTCYTDLSIHIRQNM